MKELHGAKPFERHKSQVEVPSLRQKEKVVIESSKSVVKANVSKSVQRQPCGHSGLVNRTEESKVQLQWPGNHVGRQVLPDRGIAKTLGQDKEGSRFCNQDKMLCRPCGIEKNVCRPSVDTVSRFEEKTCHRQQSLHNKVVRLDDRLPQRTHLIQESTIDRILTQEKTLNPPRAQDRSSWHGDPQKGPQICEREMKDQDMKPAVMRHQHHHQNNTQEVLEQLQRRHMHVHDKVVELHDRGQVSSKNGQTHVQGVQDRLSKCQAQSSRIIGHFPSKSEEPSRKCQNHVHVKQERLDREQAQSKRSKEIFQNKSLDVYEAQPQLQKHHNDLVDARERISSHSQKHQPHPNVPCNGNGEVCQPQMPRHQPQIREAHESRERPHRQHLQDRLLRDVHDHETKLIQRQQYLQEKVRSRKMLLGSVISSDMTFSSETCRNWQLSTLLSSRNGQQINWSKQTVLSADSGCSMGEGSSASRRNSETETDDQLKDDLPTIVAEVGEVVNRRVPSKCQKCQRIRNEMKDASSQHSHPPSEEDSPPTSPSTVSLSSGTIDSTALDVMSPPPPDRIYQCRVIRDKNTYGTMFYPVYRMYLERDGRPELLLLTARKRKKCSTSKYLICRGNDELRRKSSSLVGKLRSNLVGTRFHLATYVKGSEPEDYESRPDSPEPFKIDSLLLFYETNILGTKGPRRMKVFLPDEGRADEDLNLFERVRDGPMDGVLTLVNKEPEWDRETLSHILYFEGRVTKSSVKNFQLVEPPDESTVLLQFGKVGRNEFTLDYQPPINAVQAFAIALSSFDGKIACE